MATERYQVDVAIVGAGPAGLSAACILAKEGLETVVLDREPIPGGLPAQCRHAGFGLWRYHRLLSGERFANRLTEEAYRAGAHLQLETTVLEVRHDCSLLVTSPKALALYQARAVVLATGCREQTRSARLVPGSRPAGVYTTGIVQRFETLLHVLPGKSAVIVGSDDPGLVAAAELDRLGCRVVAVLEERPYRQGYWLNQLWSLSRRRIPLLTGYEVVRILGKQRVTGVEVKSDGTLLTLPCDTVIFSGEFVPENTLARQLGLPLDPATGGPIVDQWFATGIPGIFACGNLVHAADSADQAAKDGERCALGVLRYLHAGDSSVDTTRIRVGLGVRAVVPQVLRWFPEETVTDVQLGVRVKEPLRPVMVRIHRGKEVLCQAVRLTAKPHRSVYVPLRADYIRGVDLVVSAIGPRIVRKRDA